MIEQLNKYNNNVLAITIIDGFTKTDEELAQKLFKEKIDKGFNSINLLIKLDELKISKSSIKAFFEDSLWALRNYKKMGHIAVVAHSKIIKAGVPIDKLFFDRASKGRLERYFDVSQMDEALKFVNSNDYK